MNSIRYPQKARPTLLIRLRALVHEELAVSDEVLHGLNNIGLNGHVKALVCDFLTTETVFGFGLNVSLSFPERSVPSLFDALLGHLFSLKQLSLCNPVLQETHSY